MHSDSLGLLDVYTTDNKPEKLYVALSYFDSLKRLLVEIRTIDPKTEPTITIASPSFFDLLNTPSTIQFVICNKLVHVFLHHTWVSDIKVFFAGFEKLNALKHSIVLVTVLALRLPGISPILVLLLTNWANSFHKFPLERAPANDRRTLEGIS